MLEQEVNGERVEGIVHLGKELEIAEKREE
jgi:hypothetical protein